MLVVLVYVLLYLSINLVSLNVYSSLCLSSSHINDNRYRLEVLFCLRPDSLALIDRLKLVLYSRGDCSTTAAFLKCSDFF